MSSHPCERTIAYKWDDDDLLIVDEDIMEGERDEGDGESVVGMIADCG